jgi:hypothetical protein
MLSGRRAWRGSSMDVLLYILAGAGVFLAYAAYLVAVLAGWGARTRVVVTDWTARHSRVGETVHVGLVAYRVGRIAPGELWVSRPLWWRAWRWVSRWRR